MKNCPVNFFLSRLSVAPNTSNYSSQIQYIPRLFADVAVSAVHSHSGNKPAVTCDFISPTSLGRLKLLLFHRLFPPAEGGCCWRCPRRCREWGAQGPLFSCREGQGGGTRGREGLCCPGDLSPSPRPGTGSPPRAPRAPAPHPASPLGPARGPPHRPNSAGIFTEIPRRPALLPARV